jgi:hypothetical protein
MTTGNEPERTPELMAKSLENGVELPDYEVGKADSEVEIDPKIGVKVASNGRPSRQEGREPTAR